MFLCCINRHNLPYILIDKSTCCLVDLWFSFVYNCILHDTFKQLSVPPVYPRKMNAINFTNNRIKAIEPGVGRVDYQDSGQKGLTLRVFQSGVKTFRFFAWNRRVKRREVVVLGRFPDLSVTDARDMCEKLLREMTMGVDVRPDVDTTTLHDAYLSWIEKAKVKNKRWDQDESRYILHIQPYLGKKLLSDITPDMVIKWRNGLLNKKKQRGGGTISKGGAHRCVIILSSIFGSTKSTNPCSAIDHFRPVKRTVFLKSDELPRFFKAVEQAPRYLRDYLFILLYTGARTGNVLAMRWEDIDMQARIWIVKGETTKNGLPLVVPLCQQALQTLKVRRETCSGEWVFPSIRKSASGHMDEPKHVWKAMLRNAGLSEEFRFHDLRRTLGSWQAITGTSLNIIGASLGHKSTAATEHYAHLVTAPIAEAIQRAADEMDKHRS